MILLWFLWSYFFCALDLTSVYEITCMCCNLYVKVEALSGGEDLYLDISRGQFETMCSDIFERAMAPVHRGRVFLINRNQRGLLIHSLQCWMMRMSLHQRYTCSVRDIRVRLGKQKERGSVDGGRLSPENSDREVYFSFLFSLLLRLAR